MVNLCSQCGQPRPHNCSKPKEAMRKKGTMDFEVIGESRRMFIQDYPFGKYPHCNEHGAMLKVSKDGIWRCGGCEVGVEFKGET